MPNWMRSVAITALTIGAFGPTIACKSVPAAPAVEANRPVQGKCVGEEPGWQGVAVTFSLTVEGDKVHGQAQWDDRTVALTLQRQPDDATTTQFAGEMTDSGQYPATWPLTATIAQNATGYAMTLVELLEPGGQQTICTVSLTRP